MTEREVLAWFGSDPLKIGQYKPLISHLESLCGGLAKDLANRGPFAAHFGEALQVWEVLSRGAVLSTTNANRVFAIGRRLARMFGPFGFYHGGNAYVLLGSANVPAKWVEATTLNVRGADLEYALSAASRHPEARKLPLLRAKLSRAMQPLIRCNLLIDATDEEWVVHVRWLLAHYPAHAVKPIEAEIDRAARLLERCDLGPLLALENEEAGLLALKIIAAQTAVSSGDK